MFTQILKNDWFKKKATFVRSGKVEMISPFQGNQHFRKVLVNKTFTHVQGQKSDVAGTFRLHSVKDQKTTLACDEDQKTTLAYDVIISCDT